MINIKIQVIDNKTESSIELEGAVKLYDIAMTILELERYKQKLLDESEKYDSDIKIEEGDGIGK
ncbi:unnamed protein product [marine sediment metagenome]|uniref:Uncharacterized protein n=1 Tax=marine sediment metagenome TaxID=412755 RepID=X0TQT1_9ZZZZ